MGLAVYLESIYCIDESSTDSESSDATDEGVTTSFTIRNLSNNETHERTISRDELDSDTLTHFGSIGHPLCVVETPDTRISVQSTGKALSPEPEMEPCLSRQIDTHKKTTACIDNYIDREIWQETWEFDESDIKAYLSTFVDSDETVVNLKLPESPDHTADDAQTAHGTGRTLNSMLAIRTKDDRNFLAQNCWARQSAPDKSDKTYFFTLLYEAI